MRSASADSRLFDAEDRSPETPSFRTRLEALDHLEPDEQAALLAVIESATLRHQARQAAVS